MKRLILIFVFLAGLARAATHTAATTSYADVNAAYLLCVANDTLAIPAGSSTWGSTLNVTIPLIISGAGSGSTIISFTGRTAIIWNPSTNGPCRLTGVAFTNTVFKDGNPSVQLIGLGAGGGHVHITQWRIDHCAFTRGDNGAINLTGYVTGVADHNTGLDCNNFAKLIGDNNTAWTRAIVPGGSDSNFFENNTITVDNAPAGNDPSEAFYHQDGARSVVRNNTFDYTAYTSGYSLIYDNHGNFPGGGGSPTAYDDRGQPTTEFYNNTVHIYDTYRWMHLRGGVTISFGNNFIQDHGSLLTVFSVTEEDGYQWAAPLLLTAAPGWDQLRLYSNNDKYNTSTSLTSANGIVLEHTGAPTSDAVFIQNNRDYFFGSLPASGQSYYDSVDALTTNFSNYVQYPYPFSFTQFSSASVNSAGTTLTVNFTVNSTSGAGGSNGMALTASGGADTATYSSGSGSTAYVYTLNRAIASNETLALAYTQPTSGIQDTSLQTDTPSFSGKTVTNNSTQGSGNTATGISGKVILNGNVVIH